MSVKGTPDGTPSSGLDATADTGEFGSKVPAIHKELDEKISEIEQAELVQRIQGLRRKQNRHLLWAVLGFSPGAAIPALGLMREGSTELLLLLGVAVVLTQLFLWSKSGREIDKLEEQLNQPPSS